MTCPEIPDKGDDDLCSDLQGGTAGLLFVRYSGSIKGCLVFVQKYFYLYFELGQDIDKTPGTFKGRGMDRGWLFDLTQSKVDAFKGAFDGGEYTPAFPMQDPFWYLDA